MIQQAWVSIAGGSKESFITAQDTGCYRFDKDSDSAAEHYSKFVGGVVSALVTE
ncbi:MAG: hypothetical protein LLG16_07695 [Euryarchaeota archaeon]|nr:hypothetical protein [Euryarchaeota archaeon]